MIACLHPSEKYVEENLSTLTYASKAALIANTPIRNDDPARSTSYSLEIITLSGSLESIYSRVMVNIEWDLEEVTFIL